MAIFFSNEIRDAVVKELHRASNSVQIITAYCKEETFKYLDEKISSTVKEKKLLVRFRLDDILKGSTDIGILQHGLENNWEVYVRFDLHAKTYIVDNKRGLIGSANLTNSGLNVGKIGNMEMAALVDIMPNDIEKIDRLFKDAIKVDKILFENFKKQFNSIKRIDSYSGYSWDDTIMKLFNSKTIKILK